MIKCFVCGKIVESSQKRVKIKLYKEDKIITHSAIVYCYECFTSSAPDTVINALEKMETITDL